MTEPTVVVVGRLPELTASILPEVVRVRASTIADLAASKIPYSAIVFDLRDVGIEDVSRWLATNRDPSAPVVVVSPSGDEVAIDADDVLALPFSQATLGRRLLLAMELGRTRASVEALAQTLEDQRTFDQAILDGVEVGIVTTDAVGTITFANRSAKELLQLTGDVTGIAVARLLGLDRQPHELLGDEARRTLSYPLTTAEGVELDLQLALSRGDGFDDSRVGFFFIFRDVREDKEQEAARRRFEHLAAMGTMVAGFAHEVRNPVAALRSIAEELGEELVSAGLHLPHAKRMLGILERMERLVRTSLQFGRPAAPRRAAHRPWTICSAALAGVSARTMPTGHPIRVEFDPDLPDVFVDDAQLTQALVILLDNALDAAKSPRGVLIRVSRDGSTESPSVRFEVIDDGPGIAPADLSHIFDPFFTTKASGTGLGLSIAQQIVNENGARIEVSSMRGAPTCFAIIVSSPASTVSGESESP